jgi:hypothetical protein
MQLSWRRALRVGVAAAALVACHRDRSREVEGAVRQYLQKVVEAYRAADETLVDPYVNEQQGLKLTGLIGVKKDQGIALDAQLLDLQFTRIEQRGDRWVAETRERWYYRDRRIGTGEQVGEDSTDRYAMRYTFSRSGGKWILEDLEFAEPPVVGRKVAPLPVDPRTMHGLPPRGEGAAVPGAAPPPEKRP